MADEFRIDTPYLPGEKGCRFTWIISEDDEKTLYLRHEDLFELNDVLTEEMKAAGTGGSKVGGIEPVAEILNSVDKATETRILSTIEESNPDLAEQIRELMFTFEDLALIDSKQMQTVMKDVDQADMVLALKTASDAIKELIFSSMSTRAAEMVRDDLENLGPVKVSDVEAAQQKIIKVVKKLEEDGTIVIAGAGGGDVV